MYSGLWSILVSGLSVIAVLYVHSGLAFLLAIALMIANISMRKFMFNKSITDQRTNNARFSMLLLCVITSVLVVCQAIVYLKEWLLRAELNFNPTEQDAQTLVTQTIYLAKLFFAQMPDRHFADSSKILLLPVIQCFNYYFTKDVRATNTDGGMVGIIVQLILVLGAYVILVASRFRLYLSLYVLIVASVALLAHAYFKNVTSRKVKPVKEKKE